MHRLARAAATVTLFAACSQDAAPGRDAAPPDAGSDAGPDVVVPAPPEAPAPPNLVPCPPGWREVTDAEDASLVSCDPFPASGWTACAEDEAFFPGAAGCARLGPECPAGAFADDVPAGALFVRSGAAAGGDGTAASPFATIGEAFAAAPDGATIALSVGPFDEIVAIDRPVEIVGACVAGTVIAPSASDPAAAITLSAAATLRRLRIGGASTGVAVLGTGEPATLEDVAIVGAAGGGVRATSSGDLVLRRVSIRDVGARGVDVAFRGSVRLEGAVVSGAVGRGLAATGDGSALDASDVVVRDTRSLADGTEGFGVYVDHGASAVLARAAVTSNRSAGVSAEEDGASIVATDLVVSDTLADEDGLGGAGLQVVAAASVRVTLDRVAIDGNRRDGILVFGDDATLEATDVLVRDTRSATDGLVGRGIIVASGGQATLERAAILRNRTEGASVDGPGSVLRANDVRIAGTVSEEATGIYGYGIGVGGGARVEAARVAIDECTAVGVLAYGEGSEVSGSDVSIVDVRPGGGGPAVYVGIGLDVHGGAIVELDRLAIAGSLLAGAALSETGTAGTFVDLAIETTAARECGACPIGEGGGSALLVLDGAAVDARSFRLSDNVLCGVHLAGGEADLHDGEVAGNAIGANVDTPGFDVARLNDGVVYRDNGTNLDARGLPVPSGLGDLGH